MVSHDKQNPKCVHGLAWFTLSIQYVIYIYMLIQGIYYIYMYTYITLDEVVDEFRAESPALLRTRG